jgi:chromosome segregation ATPase
LLPTEGLDLRRRAEGLEKEAYRSEEENAKLKKAVAKHEEDLRVLGEHSAMMECEASDASKARDRAEAKLSKLSEEVERLRSENAKLREDHRILQAKNVNSRRIIPSLRRTWGSLRRNILMSSSN